MINMFKRLLNKFKKIFKSQNSKNEWGRTYVVNFRGNEYLFDSKEKAEQFMRSKGIHVVKWR